MSSCNTVNKADLFSPKQDNLYKFIVCNLKVQYVYNYCLYLCDVILHPAIVVVCFDEVYTIIQLLYIYLLKFKENSFVQLLYPNIYI